MISQMLHRTTTRSARISSRISRWLGEPNQPDIQPGTGAWIHREYTAGTVIWRDKGETHNARNVGARRYHQLLVELKQ